MKNTIFSLFLALLLTVLPVKATVPEMGNQYVAVIASTDLSYAFINYPQYKTDSLDIMSNWTNLPAVLDKIAKNAGDNHVFLDLYVHGAPEGLFLHQSNNVWHRTNMGYVVSEVQKRFSPDKVTLVLESCEVGYAYKLTIRDAAVLKEVTQNGRVLMTTDVIYNLPTVPVIEVLGANINFDGIGPIMYLQERYNFRRYWEDLRHYDSLGDNKKLPVMEKENISGLMPDTEVELMILDFFSNNIP